MLLIPLLTAWHTVVAPVAENRVVKVCNRGEWQHKRSLRIRSRFCSDNIKHCARLFQQVVGVDKPESDWYFLPVVKSVINLLFEEACQGNSGRWKWEGFFLEPHEKEHLPYMVLRAYLLGVDAEPEDFEL